MEDELFVLLGHDYSHEISDLMTTVDLLAVKDIDEVCGNAEHSRLFEVVARQLHDFVLV